MALTNPRHGLQGQTPWLHGPSNLVDEGHLERRAGFNGGRSLFEGVWVWRLDSDALPAWWARVASSFSISPAESTVCLPRSCVTSETMATCSTVSMRKNAVSKSGP